MTPRRASNASSTALQTASSDGSWSLVREFGIEYAPVRATPLAHDLVYPSLIEPGAGGRRVLVDELFYEKQVTITAECRTLHLSAEDDILYDSVAEGIHDGYGCAMDGGRLALLRRTRWLLLVLSPAGRIEQQFDLTTVAKGMPRLVTWTTRGTFLVTFVRSATSIDIVELDADGRVVWYLPRSNPPLGFTGSTQLLPNNNLLVDDEYYHVVVEIARDGTVIWQHGQRGAPSSREGHLANPKAARQGPDGRRFIADTRNHRIVSVAPDGQTNNQYLGNDWSSPSFVQPTGDGHIMVCDAGNRRVVELDAAGDVVWEYGQRLSRRRWFSFPRSVEVFDHGYLVADTAHNRVVTVSRDGSELGVVPVDTELFWPRCVRRASAGGLLIADGRNSRVVQSDPSGGVSRELAGFRDAPLRDPHDVWDLPDGHLLVTDSPSDAVVAADWKGTVTRRYANGCLSDPHAAQMLPDGGVLICDTGNSRIVWTDDRGNVLRTLEAVRTAAGWHRLARPRYAQSSPDGTVVIADSDNHRVLATTPDGTLLWQLTVIPQSRLLTLSQPRWVCAVGRDEVVVSDHRHHRVVHLRRGNRG